MQTINKQTINKKTAEKQTVRTKAPKQTCYPITPAEVESYTGKTLKRYYFVAYVNWLGKWVIDGGQHKNGLPKKTFVNKKAADTRAELVAMTKAENGRVSVRHDYKE